jgi:hypothetical protein
MKGIFKTLISFGKISDLPLYSLDYAADYQLERLLAMGAGSDVQFAENVCKILLGGLPVKIRPEGACSTFVAATPEGDRLFARNFDYKTGMAILVNAAPKNGYRSLASVYSPLDGINEKGFAVAVNTAVEQITHQDTGKTKVMTTLAIRMLLDKAADVEEGINILKNVDMNSSGKIGYHFQMADQKGDSAIIEYIDNKMVVIRKERADTVFCLTNFTLSTNDKNGTGKERFEIIENSLKESNATMSEKKAMNILDEARMDGHRYYEPGHMYYDSKTQWSVIYNLSKCTATISVGSDFSKSFKVNLKNV